jgi:peptidoglycan hydrolase-like protein with peptidoglycan-binding domain
VIIFYNWGFWGWYGGWWYPAWGYDPYYSYYQYAEPIYGYDGLTPEEIIANVQGALQELGYYEGPIDGLMGELTRASIASFQRDNALPITGTIDDATLAALGLTSY